METHTQTNRKKGPESERKAAPKAGTTRIDKGGWAAREPIDVNGCVRRLVRVLSPAERARLRTALADGELPVMGIPTQVTAVFFALFECANRLTQGGNINIITALLPVDGRRAGEAGSGACVLLSFQARTRGGERVRLAGTDYDILLDSLSNVRNIVEKHHGSFRTRSGATWVTLTVYLPLLMRTPPLPGKGVGIAP